MYRSKKNTLRAKIIRNKDSGWIYLLRFFMSDFPVWSHRLIFFLVHKCRNEYFSAAAILILLKFSYNIFFFHFQKKAFCIFVGEHVIIREPRSPVDNIVRIEILFTKISVEFFDLELR